ncbi:MAG: hypothetical protein U0Z53_16840 [Blastocatellia bacterium]
MLNRKGSREVQMIVNKILFVAAVLCLTIVLALPVAAQQTDDQKKALKGLKNVFVLVEGLSPDAEQDGLTAAILKTDVELRLRKAGIRVLSLDGWAKTPGVPILYVNVALQKNKAGFYACALNLFLIEKVLLERDLMQRDTTVNDLHFAVTWRDGAVATKAESRLRTVREDLSDLVDSFINDYLATNPPNS